MRSAGLLALVLIAGCAQSGADLFKKLPAPDASSDAFVVPTADAMVDAVVPDAQPDAWLVISPEAADASPDAN
jgi:hypothetical protein